MRGYRHAWMVAATCAAQCFAALHAGEREFPIRTERETIRYVVNTDGSYSESREERVRVLKETALESAKSTSVSYSTSIQQIEIIEAYTLKADGRKVPVPAGNFQVDSRSGREGDSPFYSDNTTTTVVFPDLAVGDATVFSYRTVARHPMFDGQFSVIESFNPTAWYGDVDVSIDAPESMPATHQSWQLRETRDERSGGRRTVAWHWSNRAPVDPESLHDGVFNVERFPGYAFSTFTDYAQIAAAYGARAEAKAVPTPRIRKLAADIAGDAGDPREIAKRLYEWVSHNIDYAGNCIGLGAVVPRDLDVVLDNKMGDCKDHATLLQSLLAARGVDSTQALINAGSSYTLSKVPVASMVNHVINYIPSLDLYLDSTATSIPFGSLPKQLAGKPVLLVSGHREGATTPALRVGNDWQTLKTHLTLAPDGSVHGSQRLDLSGRLAVAAREQFRNMAADDIDKLVRSYFRNLALKASGKVRFEDPKPSLERFWVEADFDVEHALPTSGGLPIRPWFASFAPVQSLAIRGAGDEDAPAGETDCSSFRSEEDYVFEFPAGTRIAALPSDLSVDEGNISFVADHRREGNTIRITRTLDDRTPGPLCSPDYNAEYARTMRRILPVLREQIVYLAEGQN